MEIFEGLDFASEDERTKFDIVVKKCLGDTNETYERFLFNSRQKNETETVDQYITALRTLAKTCNFCACLRDSLIRDRLVIPDCKVQSARGIYSPRTFVCCLKIPRNCLNFSRHKHIF